MIDLPDTEVVPLVSLLPFLGGLQGQAADIQPSKQINVAPTASAFPSSRYDSSESWLLNSPSTSQTLLSWVVNPLQDVPAPVQISPINLGGSLTPWAEFLQISAAPEAAAADIAAAPQQDSQKAFGQPIVDSPDPANTVQDWVAISDVRIVVTDKDTMSSPIDHGLLARCTDLSSETALVDSTAASSLSELNARSQVWLKEHYLGDVGTPEEANSLALQIRQLLRQSNLDPHQIVPVLTETQSSVSMGGLTIWTIDPTMAQSLGYQPEWMAVSLANNLRQALGASTLDAGTVQMALAQFEYSDVRLQGTASWYGPYFHGRLTATGEIFDQNQLTVAHKTLPFGTQLKVRNVANGRTVVVRVNDRGPYIGQRSLDLSKAAAQCLGSEHVGVITYEAVILKAISPLDESVALTSTAALSANYN